jgi:hypothetical protein
MQGSANSRVFFQVLGEWKIGALITAFENVFEISNWLVRMNQQ